ncbi:uncharacterized protein VTP21DRAFT_6329 [Calcarisporiella thermophila]|uniref:uncharacterized protein n=1 Tax=Calcarisporiella thermophila TaxID=911321 RepID=UPI003743C369
MTSAGHPPGAPAAPPVAVPAPPPNTQPMSNLQKLAQANEQAWLQMGTVAEIMMEYDRAMSCYEAALNHSPYSIPALQHIAALCRGREQFGRAIEYFQRILRIQENSGEIWGALGHCYLMIDDLQQAYHAYQQALYHLPDAKDPKLWYGIGILYDRYGSLEHAEEAFTAVMRMEPKFEKANEIYFRLGIIYKQQQKYDLSLQCFRYILNSPPRPLTEIDVWFQIGHVYEQQKEYNLAKEAYERVLQENPDHAKALQQLGWLYDQNGASFANQEMAINYLTRSLKIDGNDAQSWYLLGRCYMAQQNYSKAYEAYQQAVYRDGRNPTFWCSIGVLYYQINQYQDALDAYSRAIRINPMISEVWYDLGTLYESCNNQLQDALDAYQRAYELDPSNPHIKQRLTLVKQALQQGVAPATAAPMPQDVNLQAYHQNANAASNGPAPHFNQAPPVGGPPPGTNGPASVSGPPGNGPGGINAYPLSSRGGAFGGPGGSSENYSSSHSLPAPLGMPTTNPLSQTPAPPGQLHADSRAPEDTKLADFDGRASTPSAPPQQQPHQHEFAQGPIHSQQQQQLQHAPLPTRQPYTKTPRPDGLASPHISHMQQDRRLGSPTPSQAAARGGVSQHNSRASSPHIPPNTVSHSHPYDSPRLQEIPRIAHKGYEQQQQAPEIATARDREAITSTTPTLSEGRQIAGMGPEALGESAPNERRFISAMADSNDERKSTSAVDQSQQLLRPIEVREENTGESDTMAIDQNDSAEKSEFEPSAASTIKHEKAEVEEKLPGMRTSDDQSNDLGEVDVPPPTMSSRTVDEDYDENETSETVETSGTAATSAPNVYGANTVNARKRSLSAGPPDSLAKRSKPSETVSKNGENEEDEEIVEEEGSVGDNTAEKKSMRVEAEMETNGKDSLAEKERAN